MKFAVKAQKFYILFLLNADSSYLSVVLTQ